MIKRTVSADDPARLKDEREDSDRAYNAALTALDGAVQQLRQMPHPPPDYDEHQLAQLNESWDLMATDLTTGRGWRGKVRALIWRALAPLITQQRAFNSALVDHVNRNVGMHRQLTHSVGEALLVFQEELGRLATFQHRLLEYAQQITLYVDTKDREISGLMRRHLAGGLSGLSDEIQKRWESTVARERRYGRAVDDLRSSFGPVYQVAHMLKRELGRLQETGLDSSAEGAAPLTAPRQTPSDTSLDLLLDSYKYVGSEDRFRGSTEDIRERLAVYLPHYEGTKDILDVGCGRGEVLDLLKEHGITARGVDTNHEMVEVCRERGLEVEEGDALSYLCGLPDASLGGLVAAQVVEHLEPTYLLQLLDVAFLKLRPGAKLVLETINVASWSAFSQSYIRDITHIRPLHPDTLKFLVTASGFQKVDVTYRSPCSEEYRLEPLPTSRIDGPLKDLTSTLNRNVEKLNGLLFGDQDYAVVGERP